MDSCKLAGQPKSQPPRLLKKPLATYFNDRANDHIQKTLSSQTSTQNYYAPASEKVVACQEIACLDSQLIHARNAWGKDKKGFDERRKLAKKRHENLFRSIPQFNGYYKDLFGRRDRASKGLEQEYLQIRLKDQEIRQKQKEVDKLDKIQTEIEGRLDKFSIFKTYLDPVKEESNGEFQDAKELIDRYGVLANAREDLVLQNNSFRQTIIRRQNVLDKETQLKSDEFLAYRNYLSELLDYDTVLSERVNGLEDGLVRIKTTADQRTLIIGHIKMSNHNIYKQICKSLHRGAALKPEDTLGQLLDIRLSIKELSRLNHDIRRMLKAADLTAKAEAEAESKLKKIQAEKQRRLDKLANKKTLDARVLFNLPPLKS